MTVRLTKNPPYGVQQSNDDCKKGFTDEPATPTMVVLKNGAATAYECMDEEESSMHAGPLEAIDLGQFEYNREMISEEQKP